MKLILYLVLALLAFAGALVGATALSGNLSQENLKRLFSKPAPRPSAAQPSRIDALVQHLKDREAELDQREQQVREDEDRLAKREADLAALRTELLAVQAEIEDTLQTADEEHQESLTEVAANISKMKPANAVEVLTNWPREDVVAILRLIPDRQRVKILDTMDPNEATVLLQALQEAKI